MHLHYQSLVVNHDTFQHAQHGDPPGLDIPQQFNTFDFQSFNKLYKLRKLFKAMNKERMKGIATLIQCKTPRAMWTTQQPPNWVSVPCSAHQSKNEQLK